MAAKNKKETIEIPMALAKLLAAKEEDMKDGDDYANVQEVAKSMLRLLLSL